MAELAATGAAAFTDDGRPVVSAGLMRRALQYSALTELRLALHCEEPSLSRGGHAHEGRVSAELGIGPYPSTAESVMVERDLSLAASEGRPIHLMHLSAHESVAALDDALARGALATRGGDAAPSRSHRRGRALARSEHEDEPATSGGRGSRSVARCSAPRRDLVRRDRSRPSRTTGKGRAVRGGAVRRDRVSRRRSPRCTRISSFPGLVSLEIAARAHVAPARPERSTSTSRRIEVGARANLVALDLAAEWTVSEDGFRSLSANSWLLGETLARPRREDDRRRTAGVRGVTAGYLVLEDGTVFRGRSVAADGVALRRGGLHDGNDRVPGDGHGSELRRAARLLHDGDGRQLRCRRRARRVPDSARARSAHALTRRRGLGALASCARTRRPRRNRLALARPPTARLRCDACSSRLRRERARASQTHSSRFARCRRWKVRRSSRTSPTSDRYVFADHGGSPHVAVVDYGAKRSILRRLAERRRRGHGDAAHGDGGRAGDVRRRRPLERPGRPRAVARGDRNRSGAPRPRAHSRHLPRPPAPRPRDRSSDLQAPLRPPRRESPGARACDRQAFSSRARTTASPSKSSESAEASYVSLYDGTVEGFDFPDLDARSVQFHPEAGPGPHDAWPILEGFVEELRR